MSQVRVKDYTGKTIHKKKRGFATKKEALEWERDFLNKANADMGMLFRDFVDLYFEDMGHRLKESTIISKRYMVDKKILPVFGKIPINEITPKDIRKWQNGLTAYRDKNGKPYAQTYLRAINNQITAMFNYAVKYYDLRENPCTKAGSMGKSNAEEMQFWTKAEFEQFITAVKDKPASYTAFMTMYYTGMRVGELCALTPADVDLKNNTIAISKTFQRINGKDVVWAPKTPKSNRVITIPQTLADCLKTYMDKCYEIQPNDRLFPYTKHFLNHEMLRVLWSSFFVTLRPNFLPQGLYNPVACLVRRFVVIIRMRTYMIILYIRKFFDCCVEFFLCVIIMLINKIIFQCIEISFHRSIIIWISSLTHALSNTKILTKFCELF